jgi:GT2 family glycosyltransferase
MEGTTAKIPVLFVIFNRPDVAVESFQSIRRYRPDRLYIAADGARPEKKDEQELCNRTRDLILKEIDWDCEVKKLFRDENVGCGRGVLEALTWMFETEEYGAIIEDDCVVSDDYFRFCEELLPRYKDDDRIAQINCFVPGRSLKEANSYCFTGYANISGWATWRRAWKHIDFEMKQWNQIRLKIFGRFPFFEACIRYYFWRKTYLTFRKGQKPDAWDYQWSIYIFMQRKLCIEPYANLVRNIGFGDDSTHCADIENPLARAVHGSLLFPLFHPKVIQADKKGERWRSHTFIMYCINLFFIKVIKRLRLTRFR